MVEYVREQGKKTPMIALTARDGIEDKIRGFDMGFTDYVIKPFNLRELKARIKTHLRNAGPTNGSSMVSTAGFEVNPANFETKVNGKKIELTKLEFRILHRLMMDNHAMVSLEDLITFAWGEDSTEINPPIRIHIANLRKKIGDTDYKIIRTIAGTGYIFNDPPEEQE